MKRLAYGLFGLLLLVSFTATGCSREGRSAGLGALGGAAAGVGGYEYQAHREKKKLEDDLRSGKIDQREYEIRRDQLERGSIFR
ncbi:MAG: hypothetical protein HQQ73_06210 [Desulfobulbaceae bacterium]|nr:hypothetical protein [Desulfobulbaceae bacterium]